MNIAMIKSMTGYGRATGEYSGRSITVEIRSVNHRYFDCTVKASRFYTFLEDPIKKATQNIVSRGKIDIFVTIDNSQSDDVEVKLNEHVFEAYLSGLRKMCETYTLRDDISAVSIARFPEVFSIEKKEADADELTKDVLSVLYEALVGFTNMRTVEGQKMYDDINSRAKIIEQTAEAIEARMPQILQDYKTKLETRIRELLSGIEPDQTRLLTEVAIFADRVAIDEELVRLRSHLSQLHDMLQDVIPVGRKLDFLVQELNRETNTIGSKANDIEITKMVVDIKAEIEKIREQVQNIE